MRFFHRQIRWSILAATTLAFATRKMIDWELQLIYVALLMNMS